MKNSNAVSHNRTGYFTLTSKVMHATLIKIFIEVGMQWVITFVSVLKTSVPHMVREVKM